jgi:TPP-dependent pyruvate/acetoin dehydrogenase alpha subunit
MTSAGHFGGSAEGGAVSPAVPASRLDRQFELGLYRGMQIVRGVELAIENMHKAGRMSGSFHSSLGQEACAVGVCSALRATDIVTSTHRGHGHALAKGVPIRNLFAELLGRASGVSGGRGGSMHLHHRASGFYGETAIVAGGVAWAAGAAWARKRRGRDDVAAAFIGDGAFAQGVTHEALLLARHWSSPCLIVCENNGLAHSMSSQALFGRYGAIAEMVAATGMTSRYVDGRDVRQVAEEADRLIVGMRASGEPAFLECGVYRVRPHSASDADYRYRPKDAGTSWLAANDPIVHLRDVLGPSMTDELDAIEAEVGALIDSELALADGEAQTSIATARTNVYASPELGSRG